MPWLYIIIASMFEISWAVGLKYSNGLSHPGYSLFTIITMLLSFIFLSIGVKNLPIGTAYAVWTGIGAAGTALYGILFFEESKELLRIIFILLIITGIIGLRLTAES